VTRPRKQTVEWFPHSVTHGMTMFVLEERYGIGGYYFWFRLLEMLGTTEGHFIDFENPARRAFLQAYTKTDLEKCQEILDLLAELDAIDGNLWREKIIWSENFVKGVAPVYQNRRVETPLRPVNYRQKPHSGGVTTCSLPVDYTQKTAEEEKRREGEEEKGREKDTQPPPPPGGESGVASPPAPVSPPYFTCKHFEITDEYFRELVKDYPGLSNKLLIMELKKMRDWLDDNPNRHKRTAKGHLKNPKNFIRNWLGKVVVNPQGSPGLPNEPKGFAGLREYRERYGKNVE
jgi:hypothetical protein